MIEAYEHSSVHAGAVVPGFAFLPQFYRGRRQEGRSLKNFEDFVTDVAVPRETPSPHFRRSGPLVLARDPP